MKNKIYKVLSIILPLCLSGCMGVYEGGFECPAGEGVGCKSISDVNDLVNRGEISKTPLQSTDKVIHKKPEIWFSPWFIAE